MNISFFVIAASVLLIIAAVLLIILAQDEGSGIGKPCTVTNECSSGFICDNGKCKIPIGGACTDNPSSCVTGSSCVNGVCISDIIPIPPVPPKPCKKSPCSSPKKKSPDTSSSSSTPAKCNPNNNQQITNIIQGYGKGTLYYSATSKSKSPTKLVTDTILGSAYYGERIYYITKSNSTVIQVYNLITKTSEPTISQNLSNITGLESTSDGVLYCLVNGVVYYGTLPEPLLGASITWSILNSAPAYEIATAPDRSTLHVITNPNEANIIYTENPNIIMRLYTNTVDVITNGNVESLTRPNGKYPLYKNGKLRWTDYFQRYFIDIINNYPQDIFLYISP